MLTQKTPKNAEYFCCDKCDYKCCKQCDFNKHLLTLKHKKDDAEDILDDTKIAAKFFCECGKEYKHRQGLWKHKKICNNTQYPLINEQNEINVFFSSINSRFMLLQGAVAVVFC